MRISSNDFEEIYDSIVLIQDSTDDSIFGTGFIISNLKNNNALVLTCSHVILDIEEANIRVNNLPAQVIALNPDGKPDLAVLLVNGFLEGSRLRLLLDLKELDKDIQDCVIYGFQSIGQEHQLSSLELGSPRQAPLAYKNGKLKAWNFTVVDNNLIRRGYSGSPVILHEKARVIGITTLRQKDDKVTVLSAGAIRKLKVSNNAKSKLWKILTESEEGDMTNLFDRYRIAKKEALSIYETSQEMLKGLAELDTIEQASKGIRECKFKLVIAGEVKAGKSTFINALLGEMVLPTGILQNTSAVIEISKSEQKRLRVVYGNRKIEELIESSDGNCKKTVEYPDKEVSEESVSTLSISDMLKSIASVNERYRQIPFQQLNSFLLLESENKEVDGEERDSNGFNLRFRDFIQDLYKDYNAYNLSQEDFQAQSFQYVNENKDRENIPTEIRFSFPLRKEFEDVVIVDTPGINAMGGVQDVTFEYLKEADAIILLQSVEDAIERKSSRDFAKKEATTRARDVMFLVLSKVGNKAILEVQEKLKNAKKIYGDIIYPERITHVDSLLKVIYEKSVQTESLGELTDFYRQKSKRLRRLYDSGVNETQAEYHLFRTKLKLSQEIQDQLYEDDIGEESFREKILERSNFNAVEEMLSRFASTAPFDKLIRFLTIIKSAYENQRNNFLTEVDILEDGQQSLEIIQQRIEEIEEKLDAYRRELGEFLAGLKNEYASSSASWRKEFSEIGKKYAKKTSEVKSKGEARKRVQDFTDDLNQLTENIVDEVHEKISRRMSEYDISFSISKSSIDIPKIGIKSIVKKSESKAEKTRLVSKKKTVMKKEKRKFLIVFSRTVEVPKTKKFKEKEKYRDKKKFKKQLGKRLFGEFEKVLESVYEDVENIVVLGFLESFESQLNDLIGQKKGSLDAFRHEYETQKNQDEILEKNRKKLEVIYSELDKIDSILIASGSYSSI